MTLIGCFTVPHPPAIVPEVGGKRLDFVESTVESMRRLGEETRALEPEIIVIMSPHAYVDPGRMGVAAPARYEGSLAYFGAPHIGVSMQGDAGLAEVILREAMDREIPAAMLTTSGEALELDHGAVVPLHFLLEGLASAPRLVELSFSSLGIGAHLKFGEAIGAAIDKSPSRVLYVASGDLSHRLTPDAPAGYYRDAMMFDGLVVQAFNSGDENALLGIPRPLLQLAGECGYRSLVVLFGLLRGRAFKSRVLSYEGPFGVGYLVGTVELVEGERASAASQAAET